MKINNIDGFLVTEIDGEEVCLNYLVVYEDNVFEPGLGKIPVAPAAADRHNKLLDEAICKSLDQMAVGQTVFLYVSMRDDRPRVITWLGSLITHDVVKGLPRQSFWWSFAWKDGKRFSALREKGERRDPHITCFVFTRTV